jgi:hypothetical protein
MQNAYWAGYYVIFWLVTPLINEFNKLKEYYYRLKSIMLGEELFAALI